ncbi:MAG: hypothetical protein M3P45_03105 [Acidobacteriota bacterium]|nr:hypothetical protein [Acidobacteriota bacterium]
MGTAYKPLLLAELFPQLSSELEQLLTGLGEPALTEQLSELRVLDRCRCGDDFCASFYTQPKPARQYGPGLRTLVLDLTSGI